MSKEELIEYLDRQIEYCEGMSKKYKVDKYAEGKGMTYEQMTGYYQGRLEPLVIIKGMLNNE